MSEAVIVYDGDLPTKRARLSVERQTAEICATQMKKIDINTGVGIEHGQMSMEEEQRFNGGYVWISFAKESFLVNPTTRGSGGRGQATRSSEVQRGDEMTMQRTSRAKISAASRMPVQ